MQPKKLIVGNWKMNPASEKEALSIVKQILMIKKSASMEFVLCPPFPFISAVKKIAGKRIVIGAQNASFEMEGAYTGEVSPKMLKNIGVSYVIIGHSERRAMGETDSLINQKILAALKSGLQPILCVGEKERDNAHMYLQVIKHQIEEDLAGIARTALKKIVVAYEPIWAVGKSAVREATPEESREMAVFIRKVLSDMFGQKEANGARIIYGGSVNEKNAGEFLVHGGVDGLLPGRLSLQPKKLGKILEVSQK